MSLGVPVDRYCQPYCHDAAILVNRATQFGHCRDAGADLAGTVGNYNCKSNLFNRSVELFIWRRKCLTTVRRRRLGRQSVIAESQLLSKHGAEDS